MTAPNLKILNLHAYGDHDNIIELFIPPPFSDLMEQKGDSEIQKEVLRTAPQTRPFRSPLIVLSVKVVAGGGVPVVGGVVVSVFVGV